MTTPKVSVILPVFNSEKYVSEAIESILSQTFSDFELIIIDDNSIDGSLKIIKSFNDKRIRIIENPKNLDITPCLNIGLKAAKGKYIARMDADDISLPKRLDTQVAFLDKNKDIEIVGSFVEAFGRVNGVWKYLTKTDELRANLLFNASMAHPSVLMRKGPSYDESFTTAQDYDLWTRSGKRANLPVVLLKYRTHEEQKGATRYEERAILIEKIRRRELTKFGLKFSDDEFKLHNQISFGKYDYNLTEIEHWLTRIKLHNQKVNIYDQKSLDKVIDGYWFQACLKNRSFRYYKSPLFIPSIRSLGRAAVLLTKKENKVLYILPSQDPKTPTHFVHLYEMIDQLRKDVPLYLLVENQNVLIRPFLILQAVLKGYKTIYVHYSYASGILGSIIARPLGGKVYYWHCEVFDNIKPVDKFPLALTLNVVNKVITGTETVKNAYEKTFTISNKKIQVIPNWVNLDRFNISNSKLTIRKELNLPINKKIILFAHRLAPRKGADYLPEIINRLKVEDPDIVFVIAGGGGGPLESRLRKSLPKGVIFKKSVPNVDMPRLMAASDILIMPSRQEGFPRVLIEAMAAGLPFVATNVGGVSDITSPLQKKYLVEKDNLQKFTKTVSILLKNSNKLEELASDGKKTVKKYSLIEVEKKFVDLFTK